MGSVCDADIIILPILINEKTIMYSNLPVPPLRRNKNQSPFDRSKERKCLESKPTETLRHARRKTAIFTVKSVKNDIAHTHRPRNRGDREICARKKVTGSRLKNFTFDNSNCPTAKKKRSLSLGTRLCVFPRQGCSIWGSGPRGSPTWPTLRNRHFLCAVMCVILCRLSSKAFHVGEIDMSMLDVL